MRQNSPTETAIELFRQAGELAKGHLLFHEGMRRGDRPSPEAIVKLKRSLAMLERVVAIMPDHWPSYWTMGKIHQTFGDYEAAYSPFFRALVLEKKNVDVAREFMITCLETGRSKEGVAAAVHACCLAPGDYGLCANLALAQLCDGQIPLAVKTVDIAYAADPTDKITEELRNVIHAVNRGERAAPKYPHEL